MASGLRFVYSNNVPTNHRHNYIRTYIIIRNNPGVYSSYIGDSPKVTSTLYTKGMYVYTNGAQSQPNVNMILSLYVIVVVIVYIYIMYLFD